MCAGTLLGVSKKHLIYCTLKRDNNNSDSFSNCNYSTHPFTPRETYTRSWKMQASCMPCANRCAFTHINLRVKIFLLSSSWGVHLSEWYATSRKCKDKWTRRKSFDMYNWLYTSLHNRVCQWLTVNITHTTFNSAENSGAWMFSRNTEQIGTIKWYYHSVSQIICWQVKWVILLLLCCVHSFRRQQHFGKLQLFGEGFCWAGMWQCVSICASCSWVDTLFFFAPEPHVSACITRKCSWCGHQRNLPWLLANQIFVSLSS